ncbi:hypothetical protein HU200_062809 [Digitaria exilis]|uniref:Uncharacterized protein n=1 Tax=Digitaria exilis TaxID=1010633 RepID=A0A835AEW9_9POAL|nr:hypothetical protein HU200_062809 [Digitaria exilis]
MPLYEKEVFVKEMTDGEAVKLGDIKVDEATMKIRFEDWMEYGRSYRTQEEKARRYENDFDWETYVDHINNMAAHDWYIGHEQFTVSEAVKQVYSVYLHKYSCWFNKNVH